MPRALAIHLTKRVGKPALLRCVRADGSATLAEMTVGAAHDLAHFAVETVLGCPGGFYGLLASGWSIPDFDVPGARQRAGIPDQAVAIEFVVGLLQLEALSGAPFADFQGELRRAIDGGGARVPLPRISEDELRAMRRLLRDLLDRWNRLGPGETLRLEFAPPTSAGA